MHAVKNIKVNFIFLARLFVSLPNDEAKIDLLRGGKSFSPRRECFVSAERRCCLREEKRKSLNLLLLMEARKETDIWK